MLGYYLRLSWVSIRANWVLSTLMVAAIAVGIGTCMTIVTINYLMGNNPIPGRSDVLFHVQLDSWDPNQPFDEPNEPPDQLTYIDVLALDSAQKAFRQTANARAGMVLDPEGDDSKPFLVTARANSADFFPMFDVPFLYGSGWERESDVALAQVVVLSRETNDRVFGGENSVGKSVQLGEHRFQVVGVMDRWQPMPRFYDVTTGPFDTPSDVFLPFRLHAHLELGRSGNTSCWKPVDGDGLQAFLASECIWTQFWVELPSDADRDAYLDFLNSYVTEQKKLGRFPRPLNNRLSTVPEWLENQRVVQDEAQVLLVVAVMFLAVCFLNTIGLLLSKFLAKAPEIGLRRALGASRRALFTQHLIEAGTIGLIGGLFGLVFTWAGLASIHLLFGDLIENLVRLDWVMVATAVGLAIVCSLLAGLYPTWRACSVAPASQLKGQ